MNAFRRLRDQFHRLRLRLILMILLAGLIPYTVAFYLYLYAYRQNTINIEEVQIQSQMQVLTGGILDKDYLSDPSDTEINSQLDTVRQIYGGRILLIDDTLRVIKDTNGIDSGRTLVWANVIRSLKGEALSYYDKQNNFLTVTLPIRSTADNNAPVRGVLMVVRSMDYMNQSLDQMTAPGIIGFVILGFILLGLAAWTAEHTIRPLKTMEETLDKTKNGSVSSGLKDLDYAEAEELAGHFNDFLGRMQSVEASRQEFVSNVSHELKTPLTSMKVLADSINSMEGAPLELYQEFMQDMSHEIDRETKIINDLLSLVRMNKTGISMNIASVNMNELIESILHRVRPIADRQGVELVLESFRPVFCEIDETKFSLAITNLVENAVKYNNPGGWVHVSLNADHQYCFVTVEDNGMGIPQDSLDRIFERFYRVDKSHSREIGGTGLGLAITQNAIRMHHGEIRVASELGQGTTFDVRIPLTYIVDPEEDVIARRADEIREERSGE
ncbi:GHKL domain protein [Shuttleworthella sp. MSX8B]|nr:GHKL domain protein [Shuttleworthia sp. MSX8B]